MNTTNKFTPKYKDAYFSEESKLERKAERKNLFTKIENLSFVLVAAIGLNVIGNHLNEKYLKPLENESTIWANGQGAKIWDAYDLENIPHNQVRWNDYQMIVNQKRKELGNSTLLPDLDGDGYIAGRKIK